MGKPSKYKNTERADTAYWCQRVLYRARARLRQPDLSPGQVAQLLYPDLVSNTDPSSARRQFERYALGEQAPEADVLQDLVVAAANIGLFHSSELPRGLEVLPHETAEKALRDCAQRANFLPEEGDIAPLPPPEIPNGLLTAERGRLAGPGSVKQQIKDVERRREALFDAQRRASAALRAYAAALAAADCDVIALELQGSVVSPGTSSVAACPGVAPQKERRSCASLYPAAPDEIAPPGAVQADDLEDGEDLNYPVEIFAADILTLAHRVDAHSFFDMNPWTARAGRGIKPSGAKVVQLRAKTKPADRQTRKAEERRKP